MSGKFYDIMPASDGSHNLCENGVPIARYSDLVTAEKIREEMMSDQKTYTIIVNEDQLHRLISALDHLQKRQRFLAKLAEHRSREKEALARFQMATETAQLGRKLDEIAAQ